MPPATRVLFSHSFSTTPHLIQALRNNADEMPFRIYCTHRDPHALQLHVADHAEVEPPLNAEEYADYYLRFCQQHGIEVFIPGYRTIAWIAARRAAFTTIGTRVVLAAPLTLIDILEDKAAAFKHLADKQLITLPAYHLVADIAGFQRAYQALSRQGHQVCFKPIRGYGAGGFWIIQNDIDPLQLFTQLPGNRINLATATAMLSCIPLFPELMVMEYLPGQEYSLDCLAHDGNLQVAIPRRKEGRLRLLENHADLKALAAKVTTGLRLTALFNIQVRYGSDGVAKLLEINARLSAGAYISQFSGVNFPYLAVRQALGLAYTVPNPTLGLLVTQIEQAHSLAGISHHRPPATTGPIDSCTLWSSSTAP